MNVTVAICTWNRARSLDMTLLEMRKLRIPEGIQWELLVVNNRCTDETDSIIEKHAQYLPIRRLYEEKQGLSHARNCAVAAAKSDLLVWTDDDVLVSPQWIEEYVNAAAQWPEAGYFGGTVDPLFESRPPAWAVQNLHLLECVFAVRHLGEEVRTFQYDEFPLGANMAFRLSHIRHLVFDTRLGRVGDVLLSGDETDVLTLLKKDGILGIWVGPARVRHWIPEKRMTHKYLWQWHYGAGVASAYTAGAGTDKRILGMPRWVIRRYIEGFCQWLCGYLLHDSSMRILGLSQWASSAGMLTECRQQMKSRTHS